MCFVPAFSHLPHLLVVWPGDPAVLGPPLLVVQQLAEPDPHLLLVGEHDGDAVVQRVHVDHVPVTLVLLWQDVQHVLQVEWALSNVVGKHFARLEVVDVE